MIARSTEAKPWIKMGTPWFQIKNEAYPERIYAFSINYELYTSMSARVMNCLEELAPRVELTGVEHCMDLEDFGRQLRLHVYDCTHLTIGAGAESKNHRKISTIYLKRVEAVSWRTRPAPRKPSANA